MEELQCNIVAMKRSRPKILRLNLVGSSPKDDPTICSLIPLEQESDPSESIRGPVVTPTSSPELGTSFTTEACTSSVSSCDLNTSPFFLSKVNSKFKRDLPSTPGSDSSFSGSDTEKVNAPKVSQSHPWAPSFNKVKALTEKFGKLDREAGFNRSPEVDFGVDIREAVSLTRTSPQIPPPLCSVCQHKAPVFGKPPRWFSYSELEIATKGFSPANFLAEGGFGSVHRGVLPDGQVVAVKQHKLASSQGDNEFCSEVEVLSCAQHRNVVMLIGFCVEDRRRLLVYEYICNGSLDSHLYGKHPSFLWLLIQW